MVSDNFTQENRTLKLTLPSLSAETLIPLEVKATEAISHSFSCTVDCISNDLRIDGNKLLGHSATVLFSDKVRASFPCAMRLRGANLARNSFQESAKKC